MPHILDKMHEEMIAKDSRIALLESILGRAYQFAGAILMQGIYDDEKGIEYFLDLLSDPTQENLDKIIGNHPILTGIFK